MKEIIGRGDIASALYEMDCDKDRLYFASGVSNSQEKRESEYQREIGLLISQSRLKHLVYFSSLSVFYSEGRYAKHKRDVERIVKDRFELYTIVRLGNITWGDNPHTLINHFRSQKAKGEPLCIQDTERYIVDKDEFLHWMKLIPDWSCEMNIPGRRMTVQRIVEEFV